MSTYIKADKRLEYDNAPRWLVKYMEYRLSVLNDTPNTIMTYFKTLREFTQWFSYRRNHGISPAREDDLRNIDIEKMPLYDILDVTKADVEDYLYFLTDTLKNEPSTRCKKLVTVRGFFEYLIDQREVLGIEYETNPAAKIPMPKLPQKQPLFLTAEEQRNLLAGVTGENAVRDYAMILTFLSAGLRISEIVKLDLLDVRREQMQIQVRGGKGKKDRKVPLTENCLHAIDRYLEEYRNPIKDHLETNALFISKRFKNRLTTKGVEKTLRQHFLRAGLPDITVHKLRHSAASTFAKEGVNLPVLQKILGHATPDTTEIYIHLDDGDVKRAIKDSSIHDLGAVGYVAPNND